MPDVYHSVHAAPKAHPKTVAIIPSTGTSSIRRTPPDSTAGNVVANACVGFGEPLIVTVAASASAVAVLAAVAVSEALRMVKRGDMAYRTP